MGTTVTPLDDTDAAPVQLTGLLPLPHAPQGMGQPGKGFRGPRMIRPVELLGDRRRPAVKPRRFDMAPAYRQNLCKPQHQIARHGTSFTPPGDRRVEAPAENPLGAGIVTAMYQTYAETDRGIGGPGVRGTEHLPRSIETSPVQSFSAGERSPCIQDRCDSQAGTDGSPMIIAPAPALHGQNAFEEPQRLVVSTEAVQYIRPAQKKLRQDVALTVFASFDGENRRIEQSRRIAEAVTLYETVGDDNGPRRIERPRKRRRRCTEGCKHHENRNRRSRCTHDGSSINHHRHPGKKTMMLRFVPGNDYSYEWAIGGRCRPASVRSGGKSPPRRAASSRHNARVREGATAQEA